MDKEKLEKICQEIVRTGDIKTTFGSMIDIIIHADNPKLLSKEDQRFLRTIEKIVKN